MDEFRRERLASEKALSVRAVPQIDSTKSPFTRLKDTLVLALRRFGEIDGTARGAAFAYYAFFSLSPLIVLLVTVGSYFVDRETAIQKIIGYTRKYVPLEGDMERMVFDTIGGIVEARGQVGIIASFVLVWGSLRFFQALVGGANRAWRTEMYNWWQMPLKSLQLLLVLGSAFLIGLVLPMMAAFLEKWLPPLDGFVAWATNAAIATVPSLVLFYGLVFFYRLSPRRSMHFSQVWLPALTVTILLRIVESLFVLYLTNFGKFNVVYGTFAGIMALLMWIYLSGCIIVLGACIGAAQMELKGQDAPAPTASPD